MKYPNAFLGVKKLFLSELFNIISALIMLLTAVFALFVTDNASPVFHAAGYFALLALTVASVIISVVAFVLQLAGANQARKDEKLFKKIIYFVIICAVCTIALIFGSGMFGKISAGIDEVSTLLVHVYIIMGIFAVAVKLNNEKMQKRGKVSLLIVTIVFAAAFVLQLTGAFIPEIAEPLDVIAAIIEFAGYVVCLVYLGSAKKMLSAS